MYERSRDISKFANLGNQEFSTIESLVSSPLKTGLTSLKIDNNWFDFLFEDRKSNTTLVTFTAAVPAKAKTFPIFSSRHIAEELGVNFLAFADPASGGANSLPTFWHLGTQAIDTTKIIPQIISKIQFSTKTNLLFFGSSAGGFAALNYGAQFPGSAVLVMNPRISLLNSPKRIQSYTPVNFPQSDSLSMIRSLPYDQSKVYNEPRGNRIFYIQNLQDNNYSRHHYAHFKKSTQGREDVKFILGNWGSGHVVPPKSVYVDRLRDLVTSAPNWQVSTSPDDCIERDQEFDPQPHGGVATFDPINQIEAVLQSIKREKTTQDFNVVLQQVNSLLSTHLKGPVGQIHSSKD